MANSSHAPEVVALFRALGMPENCTEFTIRAAVNEQVTATATYYPTMEKNAEGELESVTKKYKLVAIDE